MLHVVGGTYQEVCLHPYWNQLYGSGLRAAAAVSTLILKHTQRKVHLHTWIEEKNLPDINALAQLYGFETTIHIRRDHIEFQYDHAMAPPRLYPDITSIHALDRHEITASTILFFGLIEGSPSIRATNMVYDPQSGTRSLPPSDINIMADNLAIVANLTEAQVMVQKSTQQQQILLDDPIDIAKTLLIQEQCQVVIVKNGIQGAVVATVNEIHHIPSYKTSNVFSIGSGDVFSAIFTLYWAILHRSPSEAAYLASLATASYCNTQVLPISAHLEDETFNDDLIPIQIKRSKRPRVYLAGPLFTLPQLWFLNEAKRCLEEQGMDVFSPKDEVGFLSDPNNSAYIANGDLQGLEQSTVVFALLDGFDPGTVFEIGYARSRGIPVICFAESVDSSHLTMFTGTQCHIYNDFVSAIYNVGWIAYQL